MRVNGLLGSKDLIDLPVVGSPTHPLRLWDVISNANIRSEITLQLESATHEKERSDRPNALNSKHAEKGEQSGPTSKPLVGGFSNVAFTFAGLTKLGVDPETLATFPQPFRDGMAITVSRYEARCRGAVTSSTGPFRVDLDPSALRVHRASNTSSPDGRPRRF
jgi:hypothetical protein